MDDLYVRHFECRWEKIVRVIDRQRLACLFINHLLEKCIADSMHDAAADLAVDQRNMVG